MSDVRHWLWLQKVIGTGEKTEAILRTFETPEAIYEAETETLKKSGLFKPSQIKRKIETPLSCADKAISDCEQYGYDIVTPDSDFYPPLLKETADYPLVLFVWGDKSVLKNKLHIGVIGTRKPSQYGTDVAHTFTKELAQSGAVVVSGGAQGIDFTAHTTAMESGGKTLLVMGCGFRCNYLMQNEEMRLNVTKSGALISEYPPFTPPTQQSFIHRNRITAGICLGVLVIEAGERSGTLSTARRSFLCGRDVFVVTGDAKGTSFLGAHELVRSGAHIIFSAQDILSLYGCEIRNKDSFYFGSLGRGVFEGIADFPEGRNEEKKKPSKAENKQKKAENTPKEETAQKSREEVDLSSLNETERAVYDILSDGSKQLDEIAKGLNTRIRDVLLSLTNLEMLGLVRCGTGNEYELI